MNLRDSFVFWIKNVKMLKNKKNLKFQLQYKVIKRVSNFYLKQIWEELNAHSVVTFFIQNF